MRLDSKFYDKDYILDDIYTEKINKLKIGIHIHVHYIDMINIFIKHLINFPISFDLFITVNSQENKDICLKSFVKEKIIKLNNITIITVENRGRDIAPWLIEFSDIQDDYDLFCHLHTKKSPHGNNLKKWAEYLIYNLISEEASKSILSNFVLDNNISMIFPPLYYQVPSFITENVINDYNNLLELLEKLNINFELDKKKINFLFPAGTMLWYRPKILKPIFDLKLKYEDFPQEPISTTGTLAHAIERVIGIIGEQLNYEVKFYITREYLIKNIYNIYYLILNINYIRSNIYNNNIVKACEILDMAVPSVYTKPNMKNKTIISILDIGRFSLFKIETTNKAIIFIIFSIRITIKLKNNFE